MKKGVFITFEGGEGCGKSTQIELLKEYFAKHISLPYHFTREPGGTPLGDKIRWLLLNDREIHIGEKAEIFMYLVSRTELVDSLIKPALDRDEIVISDRFYDSSVAYEGSARGAMPCDTILNLNRWSLDGLTPDLTFYLRIDPELSFKRIKRELDKYESESLQFHKKVLEGYDYLTKKEPDRFCIIDATQSIEKVHQQIIAKVEELLQSHYSKNLHQK